MQGKLCFNDAMALISAQPAPKVVCQERRKSMI